MFLSSVFTFLNKWEIQIMILISMVLQGILSSMGNRRKYWANDKLSVFVWLAYLSADWWATFSLSVLSKSAGYLGDKSIDPSFAIKAFYAPFFLMHLAGPDTITAYSLEDNELWKRHSFTLAGQVGVAVYIIYRGWTNTAMNFLAIPMFIPGIIKICERIWTLRSASSEIFKASMLSDPDPGPNYARYMEDYCSRKHEGFNVTSQGIPSAPVIGDLSFKAPENVMIQDAAILQDAYIFFKIFKQLFANLILSIQEIANSRSFFHSGAHDEAFKVIEIELGFMYDVFYTKAFEFYSLYGGILRFIGFSSTLIVLLVFGIVIDKDAYSTVDKIVTYIVLVGAIILEIFAVLILLSSDWTMLWLSEHKNAAVDLLYKAISSIPLGLNKRWSNTMAQFNLIEFCLKVRPAKCSYIQKVLRVYKLLEKYRYQDSVNVSTSLKELIFEQLLEKSMNTQIEVCKQFCDYRGDHVLENASCLSDFSEEERKIIYESVNVDLAQSILLWHIATNLCYTSDSDIATNSVYYPNREASKFLSNYMLYLLVMHPAMLPNGIEQIRFQDTRAEAIEFLEERKISDEKQACTELLHVSTDIPPSEVKGDRSKSVLFDGCRLAKSLQSLRPLKTETMWKLVSHVWVEMLCFTASNCQWNYHAQQLTRGGELLTHVWLLMAHLGMTKQLQISKGHARAMLVVN